MAKSPSDSRIPLNLNFSRIPLPRSLQLRSVQDSQLALNKPLQSLHESPHQTLSESLNSSLHQTSTPEREILLNKAFRQNLSERETFNRTFKKSLLPAQQILSTTVVLSEPSTQESKYSKLRTPQTTNTDKTIGTNTTFKVSKNDQTFKTITNLNSSNQSSDSSSFDNSLNATVIHKPGVENNIQSSPDNNEPSKKHIGKRVLVGGTEYGTLLYVGNINFGDGTWCGIELEKPVGKHNGYVKGVRYFECKENHGLLAPLNIVKLVGFHSNNDTLESCFESPSTGKRLSDILKTDESRETVSQIENTQNTNDESLSGPYSLLEIEHKNVIVDTHLLKNTSEKRCPPDEKSLLVSSTPLRLKHDCEKTNKATFVKNLQLKCYLPLSECSEHKLSSPNKNKVTSPLTITQQPNIPSPSLSTGFLKNRLALTISSSLPNAFNGSSQHNPISPLITDKHFSHLSKHNSFELDDSLGILTPNQMTEFSKSYSNDDLGSLVFNLKQQSNKTISNSRTPSSNNVSSVTQDGDAVKQVEVGENKIESAEVAEDRKNDAFDIYVPAFKFCSEMSDMISPTVPDSFAGEESLGILDDEMLAETTFSEYASSNLDTTINMDLPLDPIDKIKGGFRCEQTPSPEELPLDPVCIKPDLIESNSVNPNTDSGTDPTKSGTKTSNSFITSITSITSLDTGYQGDGEMSRPASRGGDHSPTVHKQSNNGLVAAINHQCLNRAAVHRRQDPMTDSDFFTESEADGHEDNAPRGGDRKAQVIDGTLYGMNAPNMPAPEEIIVNNHHEEMDSSGVFTDLDTNTRMDEIPNRNRQETVEDQSPSDFSSNTISDNSQEGNKTRNLIVTEGDENVLNENSNVIVLNQTHDISNSTSKFKDETIVKKHTMPKRNVVSKVKAMLESTKSVDVENQENRKPSPRKNGGRWDAVMSKISDGKSKPNLKNVKSKVAAGISGNAVAGKKDVGRKPTALGQLSNNKNKLIGPTAKLKRRARPLVPAGKPTSSGNSSMSDLSSSGPAPMSPKVSNRPTKKRDVISSVPNENLNQNRLTIALNEKNQTSDNTIITKSNTISETKSSSSWRPRRSPSKTSGNSTSSKSSHPPTSTVTNSVNNKHQPAGPSERNTSSQLSRRHVSTRRSPTKTSGVPTATKASSISVLSEGGVIDSNRVTGVPVANKSHPESGRGAPNLPSSATIPETGDCNATIVDQHQQAIVAAAQQLISPRLLHAALGVEALGVLVQHLVFKYDAFKTPYLKKDLESLRERWIQSQLELEETKMGYRRLEEIFNDEKVRSAEMLSSERRRFAAEMTEMIERHTLNIADLNERNRTEKNEVEQRLMTQIEKIKKDHENRMEYVINDYEEKLKCVRNEFLDLERNHIDLKVEFDSVLKSKDDLINEFQTKETDLANKLNKMTIKFAELKTLHDVKTTEYAEKLHEAEQKIIALEESNRKVLETFKSETKDSRLQAALARCTQFEDEVKSLQTVLEMKQKELSDLRKAHAEALNDAEQLPGALQKVLTLQARVEDLEMQLERKTQTEKQLLQENEILKESFQQESKQKNRLSLQNEQLQWKLKQNAEVANAIVQLSHCSDAGRSPSRMSLHGSNQSLTDEAATRSPRTALNRSLHSSSFSEKHSYSNNSHVLERNNSFRERISSNNVSFKEIDNKCNYERTPSSSLSDTSFNSPECFEIDDASKIKAVVEKTDSVSYVLEMDESPEVLASRLLVRRSFRNTTPPKSTPTKSPAPKRQKCKTNPLSASASATDIADVESQNSDLRSRSKSVSIKTSRSQQNDFMTSSWNPGQSSSANSRLFDQKIKRVELLPSEIELSSVAGDLIIGGDSKHDDEEDYCDHNIETNLALPALPSELNRSKKDGQSGSLLRHFPKHSAGEAMISESNSEDECSTSASSDRSHSHSLSEGGSSENLTKAAVVIQEETMKMQFDLNKMTEYMNSETISWSDESDLVANDI